MTSAPHPVRLTGRVLSACDEARRIESQLAGDAPTLAGAGALRDALPS